MEYVLLYVSDLYMRTCIKTETYLTTKTLRVRYNSLQTSFTTHLLVLHGFK